MFGINLKHSLAIVTVGVGVLAAAGPASAGTHQSGVLYNGHAGLGASVYQHNQTDLEFLAFSPQGPGSEGFWPGSNGALAGVTDGTSNTIMFGEMGLRAARLLPEIDDEVLPATHAIAHDRRFSAQWSAKGLSL